MRKALDNLAASGLLYKIQGSGTFVVPRSRRAETAVASGRGGRKIAFLMTETALSKVSFAASEGNFDAVYSGLSRIVTPRGYELIFAHVGMDWRPPACLRSERVAVVLFHGRMPSEFWSRHIRRLPNVGLQYECTDIATSWVKIDNLRRSELAFRHLYELGHRRIGFSHKSEMRCARTFRGYLAAASKFGMPVNDSWCCLWQRR